MNYYNAPPRTQMGNYLLINCNLTYLCWLEDEYLLRQYNDETLLIVTELCLVFQLLLRHTGTIKMTYLLLNLCFEQFNMSSKFFHEVHTKLIINNNT